MRKLDEILEHNRQFVEKKEYEEYLTSKDPNKKILILSCMDTRLTDLLPRALNFKNGDVKIVKNAGATITHPFGSVARSIIVAVYEFDVDEIFVIGHHGCGMCNLETDKLINEMIDKGVKRESLEIINNCGININKWLHGFDSVEESIKDSVDIIKNHPLMIKDVVVHGLVMDPETGKLDIVENGYIN